MRRIPIQTITQTGANPGTFVVGATSDNPSGDWTSIFRGKYYRDSMGAELPFYTSPTTPAGYVLIPATTFSVINNGSYAGRYTVYTQPSVGGLTSAVAGAGNITTIRVNETIGAPSSPGDLTPSGSSYITNVSTFYITVAPSSPVVVPPETIIETSAFDMPGRNFSGWGEVILQNLARQTQNFAGGTAPSNPLVGQPWYNTSNGEFRIWNGSVWNLLNGSVFASANSYRHTQPTAAMTWTVNHNLNVASPFIVNHTFYVDIGGGVIKPIIPSDVTYVSANQFTVTFTANYTGYALVRA